LKSISGILQTFSFQNYMKIISGKSEIVYLISKVIEKYERESGEVIMKNSNRKNYEPIAKMLSEISNRLPLTHEELGHTKYDIDYNPKNLEYPFRKYDITGNQIKDAFFNQIVSKPRSFLVDACYIYVYGKGRKAFEINPSDEFLIQKETSEPNVGLEAETTVSRSHKRTTLQYYILCFLFAAITISLVYFFLQWRSAQRKINEISSDLKILPYKATQVEIDSLEGVWLCYTGSPQARVSDPNRYHMVVSNVVDIKYKDGYFVFTRYGASFIHDGYMQFESPWLVSVHSYVRNKEGKIESPRHSLLKLDDQDRYKSVISASWNFDVGDKNSIIGIREVYIKLGKGGNIEEVLNTLENARCKCKIIKWKNNNKEQVFELRNVLLEDLKDARLSDLLNEESILLRIPADSIIMADSFRNKY